MGDVRGLRRGPRVVVAELGRSVAVVSLLGEHDMATANDVRTTLSSLLRKGASVVIDLTETDFVDCRIMHVLEDSQRLASQHGTRVSIQSATRSIVRRVIRFIDTGEAWPVYDTRADAIRAISRAPSRRTIS